MEKTEAEITILVCGSSSYYSAVVDSDTDTTVDADVETAVSGSSYYFSAAADLEMDADAATEILFAANFSARRGILPRLFLIDFRFSLNFCSLSYAKFCTKHSFSTSARV